jgi:hypothetical protein
MDVKSAPLDPKADMACGSFSRSAATAARGKRSKSSAEPWLIVVTNTAKASGSTSPRSLCGKVFEKLARLSE